MFRLFLIVSLPFLLFSCGSPSGESGSQETTATEEAAPAGTSLSLDLDRNGLGSINGDYVLSAQNLAKTLPGFAQREMSGEGYYYYIAYWENQPAFRIYADPESKKVTSVIISHTDFIEAPKAGIGETHAQIQEGFKELSCQAGSGDYEGQILCRTATAENIQYVFELEDWPGSKSKLPAEDKLAQATLKEIIWQVPK